MGVDTRVDGDQLDIHLRVFNEDQLSEAPREAHVSGSSAGLPVLIDQLMDSLS